MDLHVWSSNIVITVIYIILLYMNGVYIGLCDSRLNEENVYSKIINLPGVIPKKNDEYFCTKISLNTSLEEWIIQFDPLTTGKRAHHMLLYGCRSISKENLVTTGYWNCGHRVCEGEKIIYAWTQNAHGVILPPDVGFQIGGDSSVNYLALQIHYAHMFPENVKDYSGLTMTVTTKRQKFKAGIYLLEAGFADIPPLTKASFVDVNCRFPLSEPINIFGFRVHTHSLGTVVTGYKYDSENSSLIKIGRGNPQWPQTFYPVNNLVIVRQNDILHARCAYNSTVRTEPTYIGPASTDEMCNLYLMYYTDREKGPDQGLCNLEYYKNLTNSITSSSDEQLSFNEHLESMAMGENLNEGKDISFDNIFRTTVLAKNRSEDECQSFKRSKSYTKDILMPGATPTKRDEYMCTGVSLNETLEEWIVLFKPIANADRVHHMMLFACVDHHPSFTMQKIWDCGHHGVCDGGKVIYAWAKNAPATHLPDGVGFRIGTCPGIRFLTLQIHYVKPLSKGTKDYSGVQLTITSNPQHYKAGIFLLAAPYVDIPPYTEKTHADLNCLVGNTEPVDINIFSFRVHTHKLGTVVTGYKYDTQENILSEIVKGNPQWPQSFYKMDKIVRVSPKDVLHARCTYNSSNSIQHTYIGATGDDEMCNLYLMYYTDTKRGSDSGGCSSEDFRTISAALPPSSDEPLPPNPILEQMTRGHKEGKGKEVSFDTLNSPTFTKVEKKSGPQEIAKHAEGFHLTEDWGPSEYRLGQITAVAVDSHGDVVIFHRGERVWDGSSFQGNILVNQKDPIKRKTILRLHRTTGKVLDEWAANVFFMPHGLSLDEEDNIWITDVGLHQVFKFPSGFGSGTPLLSLGKRFQPGNDLEHFCKPTGVAVAKKGDFFVSDGYCNSRIIHFSSNGDIIKEFGESSLVLGGNLKSSRHFRIPHAIEIVNNHQEVCVADRENGRIQCFDVESGAFTRIFKFREWGGRIFSFCYTPHFGGKLFAVNGPDFAGNKVEVFEVSYEDGIMISSFSPFDQGFSNPHDLSLSRNGTDLYVVEIGPNKIWKFTSETIKKKILHSAAERKKVEDTTQQLNLAALTSKKISADTSAKSSIFLSLVLVPVFFLALLAIIMRYRRKGIQMWYEDNKMLVAHLNKKLGKSGLNLDLLMPNRRRGFQKVATNDFGEDNFDSGDSDIEEFNVAAAAKA